jgi:hypothetical protein
VPAGRTARAGLVYWPGGRTLIFRHGAAESAFIAALAVWLVFELMMRVVERLRTRGPAARDASIFAAGRKRLVPGGW